MALAIKKSKYLSETGEKEVFFLSLEQAEHLVPLLFPRHVLAAWLRGLTDDV